METRATDWIECKDGPWYPELPHGGFLAYRIFQQTDGRRWFQRHDWKRADGIVETGYWIDSPPQWMPGASRSGGE